MPNFHLERKFPYSPNQLFELVADIKEYPSFVPWCDEITIVSNNESEIIADVGVGYKGIHKTYRCHILLHSDISTIEVKLINGPFIHLLQKWQFLAIEQGCQVIFDIDFKLKSVFLDAIAKTICGTMCEIFIQAFTDQAKKKYS